MNNTDNSDLKRSARFYTPQFSETSSVSVRRFAWFLNKPMTQAVEKIILLLPFIMDSSKCLFVSCLIQIFETEIRQDTRLQRQQKV